MRIHLTEKNVDDKIIRIVIIRKLYLIMNFKINLLINIDIINLKLINILTFTNLTYIESCKIIVFDSMKTRSKFYQLSIHTLKTIVVSFEFELLLNIYYKF